MGANVAQLEATDLAASAPKIILKSRLWVQMWAQLESKRPKVHHHHPKIVLEPPGAHKVAPSAPTLLFIDLICYMIAI